MAGNSAPPYHFKNKFEIVELIPKTTKINFILNNHKIYGKLILPNQLNIKIRAISIFL